MNLKPWKTSHAYWAFWGNILFLLFFASRIIRTNTVVTELQLHDTYFSMMALKLIIAIACFLFIIGFAYYTADYLQIRLIKGMTLIHVFGTIPALNALLILASFPENYYYTFGPPSQYYPFESLPKPWNLLSMVSSGLLIIIFAAQLLAVINFSVTILRKFRSK